LLPTNTKYKYFPEGNYSLKNPTNLNHKKANQRNKPTSDTRSKVVVIAMAFQKTLTCLHLTKVKFMSGSIFVRNTASAK